MRLDVARNGLIIYPDRNDKRDEVFIEEVLGLLNDGDVAFCQRVNAHNLNCIAYIEIRKKRD